MQTIQQFLGTNESSPAKQWLEKMYHESPAGVEELAILSQEAGFATIGHFFADRRKALPVIQKILRLTGNELTGYDILNMSLGDLQNHLQIALKNRSSKLMNFENINSQDSMGKQLRQQWGEVFRTPVKELLVRVKRGWKYDIARA